MYGTSYRLTLLLTFSTNLISVSAALFTFNHCTRGFMVTP